MVVVGRQLSLLVNQTHSSSDNDDDSFASQSSDGILQNNKHKNNFSSHNNEPTPTPVSGNCFTFWDRAFGQCSGALDTTTNFLCVPPLVDPPLSCHHPSSSNSNIMSSSDMLAPPKQTKGNTSQNQRNNNNDNNTNSRQATASQWAGSFLQNTKQTVQSWTVRKYNLPDKHVASQVLMYRQLLHTACRPNLTLSREYQGTPAQKAVLHMPWWSHGILETRKMVISYQNLVARLWVSGACVPYGESWQEYYETHPATSATASDLLGNNDGTHKESTNDSAADIATSPSVTKEEKKEAEGSAEKAKFRAPVPHKHWVDRLGFQQDDPVTDFRSGGVLSLAMMVYLVESCPQTHGRFILNGDAAVLPFGLTCINVTDMMAKFLMLSKTVDRMDALLSQKPFWRMFEDPMAMCVCQETAMQLTADVAMELATERGSPISVFDFATIMEIVEKRFEYDYLMAGPTSPNDLRKIHVKNKQKYQVQLQHRMHVAQMKEEKARGGAPTTENSGTATESSSTAQQSALGVAPRLAAVQQTATVWKDKASNVAGNVWSKMKSVPGARRFGSSKTNNDTTATTNAAHQGLAQEESATTPDLLQPEEDGFVNTATASSYAAGEEVDDTEDVDL